ncbi:Copper-exporting P-type ATPase [bioreactor metagenome]|uniref:Copper-exporting P-type ATPase n=1 Tax=bioreactor metagenome TaxID=1076179 RepID=A0A644YZF9_9ZZZZ
MKKTFKITGMTCSACSAHVEKAVSKLPGIQSAAVNLLGGTMQAEYDETALSPSKIIEAVQKAGYGASLPETAREMKAAPVRVTSDMEEELKSMKRRFATSLCFLIPLLYISMGHMLGAPLPSVFHGTENAMTFALTQFLLLLPIIVVNSKYYRTGFPALIRRAPNMDSLIAVGSAAAILYGIAALYQIGYGLGHADMQRVMRWSMDLYFESAGMILTLITLGKFLETRSKGKTGEAISRLIDLAPKTAAVLREGKEFEVPVEEVRVDDLILVRPGQSIPVDGVLFEGYSAVDESALTGESVPVDKSAGDKLMTASINKSGAFTMRATRVGEDTTLAQMIALVEEAASSKAPISKLADKVAGVFVPVVMAISAVTAVLWLATGHSLEFALTAGVAVLVISCPCALGLATPVAIMVGTGKGAECGVLFRSAEALETLHNVKTIVLDKTGTITEGKPRVTDVHPGEGVSEEELLCVAAALEKPSEHPLAASIVEAAAARNIPLCPVTDFQAVHGKGVRGVIQGENYLAGNLAMLEEEKIDPGPFRALADDLAENGKTPLYFAQNGKAIGVIAVADTVKKTSAAAIEGFKALGVEVVMLTGDNARTAAAIGRELNLDRVVSEVLPAEKERQIAAIQAEGRKVAMVGDGINDAPALVRADVGLAVGGGTDIAIESADVVLMKNDLLDALTALRLSKAVIRNIRQNLFWAFFYNVIGIPLAAGVFYPVLGWQLSPMFAAAAMSMSSFCVVSNALRLRFFKPQQPIQSDKTDKKSDLKELKGEINMQKTMKIEGMSCSHCSARVEQALGAIPGVSAKVNLEAKSAAVTLTAPVDDKTLRDAVTDAGYQVVSIS